MFYLFHHMPKCAGTSFKKFLDGIFNLRQDYVGVDHLQNPGVFEEFKGSPVRLAELGERDCLIGHYNLNGIKLSERYPDLESFEHKKFSILRDPFEAAHSALRYGIKKGWVSPDLSFDEKINYLLNRANYYARVFEVESIDQAEDLLSRYWFVAPVDRLDHAAKVLEVEVGKVGGALQTLNITKHDGVVESFPNWVVDDFLEKSKLDYYLYGAARLKFGGFASDILV